MSHVKVRTGLGLLDAFLALTAIFGAISVVHTLPADWIAGSIFPDYTVPALALGVLVGGSALLAAGAVFFHPRVGAVAAIVSAVMIIGFEVVEMATVGFSPLVHGPTMPQSWLQVVYILLGTIIAVLGARLWLAEGGTVPLAHGIGPRGTRTLG